MQKIKRYPKTKFDANTIAAADKVFRSLPNKKIDYVTLEVDFENERWSFDSLPEFLAATESGPSTFHAVNSERSISLFVHEDGHDATRVSVGAPTREEIASVFSVFENNAERCRVPVKQTEGKESEEVKVFIGHGRDPQWRDLKDHLHEKHGYAIEAYEIGSRAGHSIRDILEDMLEESSFALLVMTGEDETKDGNFRARQNVVHEAGLFQGRLGFSRAIILLEEGTEDFSNINGLHQIRFAKGRVAETFGEVLAVLKREMK
jgi:predicted nucleotide-binding protein